MNSTTLLLGTNLGNRRENINKALEAIASSIGTIEKKSPLYQTASWGREDLPYHYNQAIITSTELSPKALLSAINHIENNMGRIRQERWGERVIDIDIIFYNDEIIHTEKLEIPHPRLHERKFALIPIADLIPDYIHPILNKSMKELLIQTDDKLSVNKLSE